MDQGICTTLSIYNLLACPANSVSEFVHMVHLQLVQPIKRFVSLMKNVNINIRALQLLLPHEACKNNQ